MKIEFTNTAPGLLAVVTKISRDEAKAVARYMGDRNLIAHASFDGFAKLEFFVPEMWEGEDHATRYVSRVLTEIRMADTPF
jgi:hypothetical protein